MTHETAWLNDNVIAAAQNVLKRQTVMSGLQPPPCIGQTCSSMVQYGECFQFINNGHGHRLKIAVNYGLINIYKQLLYKCKCICRDQVAAIVHTSESKITLNFFDVQIQVGSCDCRFMAVVFATSQAYGKPPEVE